MIKKLILAVISLIVVVPITSKALDGWGYVKDYSGGLSEYAEISVITCDPGDQVYSLFGHTALRVKDPARFIDEVYNYGTFKFNTPNFYLKFSKGDLDYFLSVRSFQDFIYEYQVRERGVREQVLDLTPQQKNELFIFLEKNRRVESRNYRYKFFEDNCSTRVLNLVLSQLDEKDIKLSTPLEERRYIDILDPYLEKFSWVQLGIHVILGAQSYKKANWVEQGYIPELLERDLDMLTCRGKKVVKSKNTLLGTFHRREANELLTPGRFFLALSVFLLMFTYIQSKGKLKDLRIIDVLFFTITGVAGIVILIVSICTLHIPVTMNFNILWLLPTHLMFGVMITSERFMKSRICLNYCLVSLVLLVAIVTVNVTFQLHNYLAFYLINLCLATRLLYFFFEAKKATSEREKLAIE